MYRAAHFAMQEMLKRWPSTQAVSVVCGSGNNAGDGYLLAGALHARGISVQIVQVGDVNGIRGDAKKALESISHLDLTLSQDCDLTGEIVVDALLGTGAKDKLRPNYVDAVKKINTSGKRIVALDLPSGVHSNTGGFLIEEPVKADLTVCFVCPKFALMTGKAVNVAGEVVTSTLDIPAEAFTEVHGLRVLPTSAAEQNLPTRNPSSHKRNFGHVLIVGGNLGMGGAALLAGDACLRSGAGLVSIVTHPEHAASMVMRRPELMVRGSTEGAIDWTSLSNVDVVAIGPGLGQDAWARRAFSDVVASGRPLVVDADALNILAQERFSLPPNSIVTPHPGEAGRLLNTSTLQIENDRMGSVKQLTEQLQCAGVLKGAGSLVASKGAVHGICDIAEPALSTAGSGDVLTGVIAAAYAQIKDPLSALALGVYIHAKAGQKASYVADGRSVIASDLITALRPWG